MGIQNAFFPRNAILAALLYSGFISSTILTIGIQKSSRLPLGCKKIAFLHDNRLRFPDYYYMVLLDFSLTVKAATLIFMSGRCSAISSVMEGKSGFIYNFVKT